MNSFRNQNEPSKKISPSRRVRPSRCFTGSGLAWHLWVKRRTPIEGCVALGQNPEWITIEQPELAHREQQPVGCGKNEERRPWPGTLIERKKVWHDALIQCRTS